MFSRGRPLIPLQFVASCTSSIRLGAEVVENDFRNLLLLLARESVTLDVLSEGRLDLGLGAGWQQLDYDWSGIPFDDGATRAARLEEAPPVLGALLAGETVAHEGRFYGMREAACHPRQVQRPHPPLKLRFPRHAVRYAQSLGGGVLMGLGAGLAIGCTIGAFFFGDPVALAISGWLFAAALAAGSYLGVHTIRRIP